MTDGLTGSATYVPDPLNRTDTLTNPSAGLVDLGYDALSRAKTTELPNNYNL